MDAAGRPLTLTLGRPSSTEQPAATQPAAASHRGAGEPGSSLRVTAADLQEESLTLDLAGLPDGDGWRVLLHLGTLRDPSAQTSGALTRTHGDRGTVVLDLRRDHWGRTGLALPAGKYAVHLVPQSGPALTVTADPALLDRLPLTRQLDRYRASVEIFPGPPPTLALRLRAPLEDHEWGRRNQRRLRDTSAVGTARLDVAFFRALYGEAANCNGLGVHHELRRRGTGLDLVWSVVDHSVPVPEGGRALVEGTTAWHAAIAGARYQMVNVHQLNWFHKPEGQVLIQTMHGYPYKIMGHEWWDKGSFPGPQVANYDRRAREWDYFVSPASYATPLLRAAFLTPAGATCEVLEIGYPRNDVLLSSEAEAAPSPVGSSAPGRDRTSCSTRRPSATTCPTTT